MIDIIELLNCEGGFEIVWDYCLENNIAMPCDAAPPGSQSSRDKIHNYHSSGSGKKAERGFSDHARSRSGSYIQIWSCANADTGHGVETKKAPWSYSNNKSWNSQP